MSYRRRGEPAASGWLSRLHQLWWTCACVWRSPVWLRCWAGIGLSECRCIRWQKPRSWRFSDVRRCSRRLFGVWRTLFVVRLFVRRKCRRALYTVAENRRTSVLLFCRRSGTGPVCFRRGVCLVEVLPLNVCVDYGLALDDNICPWCM